MSTETIDDVLREMRIAYVSDTCASDRCGCDYGLLERYSDRIAKARAAELERFRSAVSQWRAWSELGEVATKVGPFKMKRPPEEYAARTAEADELLAHIDRAKEGAK